MSKSSGFIKSSLGFLVPLCECLLPHLFLKLFFFISPDEKDGGTKDSDFVKNILLNRCLHPSLTGSMLMSSLFSSTHTVSMKTYDG